MSLYASIAIVTLGLSLGLTSGLYLISTSDNSVKSLQPSPVLVSLMTGDKFFSFMIINLIDVILVLNREVDNMNEVSLQVTHFHFVFIQGHAGGCEVE